MNEILLGGIGNLEGEAIRFEMVRTPRGPRQVVAVPQDEDFDSEGSEFLESVVLRDYAEDLIATYPALGWLSQWSLRYLWKRTGGSRNGQATLGKCLLPSPIVRHYARCDWFIYISADNCHRKLTEEQFRALIFHELCHCTLKYDMRGENPPRPAIVGHDLEMFFAEVREFGLWKENLEIAAAVFDAVSDC